MLRELLQTFRSEGLGGEVSRGAAGSFALRLGSTLFEASVPGLYTASVGAARAHVAVNLPAGLSDVNGVTLTGRETVELPPGRWLSSELWTYLLALALVLVTLEWWTYHRRITV